MLLAVDVGNSEVTTGLFRGPELLGRWRLTTDADRTPDEWSGGTRVVPDPRRARPRRRSRLLPRLGGPGCDSLAAPGAPVLDRRAHRGCRSAYSAADPARWDEPLAVGADRIANALGALALYPGPSIVIGFGTATTFIQLRHGGPAVRRRVHHAGPAYLGPTSSSAVRRNSPRRTSVTAHHVIGRQPMTTFAVASCSVQPMLWTE